MQLANQSQMMLLLHCFLASISNQAPIMSKTNLSEPPLRLLLARELSSHKITTILLVILVQNTHLIDLTTGPQ